MRIKIKENSNNVMYLSAHVGVGVKFIVEKKGASGIFHSFAFSNPLRANTYFKTMLIGE